DVAEDHEGRGPSRPALALVGAARLLAHGVQPVRAQQAGQSGDRGARRHRDLQPARLRARGDAMRVELHGERARLAPAEASGSAESSDADRYLKLACHTVCQLKPTRDTIVTSGRNGTPQ